MIDFNSLPEAIRKKLEEPVSVDVPPGKDLVDGKKFSDDLDSVGSFKDRRVLRVVEHPDTVEELNKPINEYERIFFTNTLLFEVCGIDTSVSDRFRAEKGEDVDSRLHPLKHSVVRMGDTNYEQKNTASMVQSVPIDSWSEYSDYICSLNIVNRKDNVVWFFKRNTVTVLDPYIVDGNGSHGIPYHVHLYIFCPGTFKGFIVPKEGSMFSNCCDLTYESGYSKGLEDITKAILNGK